LKTEVPEQPQLSSVMIHKELILTNVNCDTAEEILRKLAVLFVEHGFAKDSFIAAIIEREKMYPTGIPAAVFDIAIPHTVSEHVIEPAIAVAVLEKPVEFKEMGSPDITLHPHLIIMMAIKNPKEQNVLLRKMIDLIQNNEALKAIRECNDEQAVVDVMLPLLQ
jgi:PTS system galactitol-specific IIA component